MSIGEGEGGCYKSTTPCPEREKEAGMFWYVPSNAVISKSEWGAYGALRGMF